MKRKHPLGDNPLDPETVLREMVRGGRARPQPDEEEPAPAIRKTSSTTTPGGLLRKTVYFTEAEWRAIDDQWVRHELSLPEAQRRMWALAVQLYGIRSRRNWGHGDFSDLLGLIDLAVDLGASGIGLNPLHALFDDRAELASPYSPNTRLFLNPLYAADDLPDDGKDGLVDWPEASQAKLARLRDRFSGEAANADARLRDHARFEALDTHFRKQGLCRWHDWPRWARRCLSYTRCTG